MYTCRYNRAAKSRVNVCTGSIRLDVTSVYNCYIVRTRRDKAYDVESTHAFDRHRRNIMITNDTRVLRYVLVLLQWAIESLVETKRRKKIKGV